MQNKNHDHINTRQAVILLHGLNRTSRSMSRIEHALKKRGFDTFNINYPSRRHCIERLSEISIEPAVATCYSYDKIHFVTHSLGGIVVRQYLKKHHPHNLGNVVMLAPPNHGSEVVDKLKDFPGFSWLNGPACMQLTTDSSSIPNTIGKAGFKVGIIAGTRCFNPIFAPLLSGKSDGTVTVESTKLIGMTDHIELPVTHTCIMFSKAVIQQTISFIANGGFIHH